MKKKRIKKVLCGGAYILPMQRCQCTRHAPYVGGYFFTYVGFRLKLSL